MTILYDGWTPTTRIYLRAWVMLEGGSHQCEIITADAATQTADVVRRGQNRIERVPFHHIQNVALVSTRGEVIQNFGAPKLHREESILYIPGHAPRSEVE
ncbi:MAG: hypothetical protein L0287_28670 [Anaerolineae bacterium]|nr:hypothetical protein [Anaerolineae bacterium]